MNFYKGIETLPKCEIYTLRAIQWTSLVPILPDSQCNVYYTKHIHHLVNDNGTGQVIVNLFLNWCIKSNAEKRHLPLTTVCLGFTNVALQTFISYTESNLSSHCSLVDSTKTDTNSSSQINKRQVYISLFQAFYICPTKITRLPTHPTWHTWNMYVARETFISTRKPR